MADQPTLEAFQEEVTEFLEANAKRVKEPTILGGSGAVNGVADRAVQEALGLRD